MTKDNFETSRLPTLTELISLLDMLINLQNQNQGIHGHPTYQVAGGSIIGAGLFLTGLAIISDLMQRERNNPSKGNQFFIFWGCAQRR
jgi:hypothetical protein